MIEAVVPAEMSLACTKPLRIVGGSPQVTNTANRKNALIQHKEQAQHEVVCMFIHLIVVSYEDYRYEM